LTSASPEVIAWIKKMWSDPTIKAIGKDIFRQAKNPDTLVPHYEDLYKGNDDIKFGQFEEDWEFTVKETECM